MKRVLLFLLMFCAQACSQERTIVRGDEETGYALLGAVLGAPTGIAFVGGYSFNSIALRISGGGWGEHQYGIQGDCSLILNRGSLFSHGISVFAGRFSSEIFDQTSSTAVIRRQDYAGLGYDLYLSGFFLEAGLGFGSSRAPEYRNPIPIYQAGYLFHF